MVAPAIEEGNGLGKDNSGLPSWIALTKVSLISNGPPVLSRE
jgi:hypothetical protein